MPFAIYCHHIESIYRMILNSKGKHCFFHSSHPFIVFFFTVTLSLARSSPFIRSLWGQRKISQLKLKSKHTRSHSQSNRAIENWQSLIRSMLCSNCLPLSFTLCVSFGGTVRQRPDLFPFIFWSSEKETWYVILLSYRVWRKPLRERERKRKTIFMQKSKMSSTLSGTLDYEPITILTKWNAFRNE